jgi:hypothetical protein
VPVTDSLRALGQWSLSLSTNTPREILTALKYLGHIAILPGRVQPELVGDGLLTSSAYTGVLRGIGLGDTDHDLSGCGMAFWLGDEDGKGSVYEEPVTIVSELPADAVRALLPASGAVTEGMFHAVAGTYSGMHQWETPRSAIDYAATTLDAEWRVNGNATLDFGTEADLFVTDPKCMIVRRGMEGTDYDLRALAGAMSTASDVDDFTTRVVLLAQGTEAATLTATADIDPGLNPYKDLHGNPVELTRMVSESTTDATNAPARAQLQLNRFSGTRDMVTLSSDSYWIAGSAVAGDYVWVFDPDIGLFDTDNEVVFRGVPLYPAKLRLTEVTWPIKPGFMVAYRDPDGVWLDLTDYVLFEGGQSSLKVGGYNRALVTSGEVVGTRPNRDTSRPAVTTWVEPFLLSVYQSPGTGAARGAAVLKWTRPLNEDGSTILDGSHYEIRYRTSATAVYPITWDDIDDQYVSTDDIEDDGATWDHMIIYEVSEWQHATTGFDQLQFRLIELMPATPYEVQIRAVDMATPPNVADWSASAAFQTTRDDVAPATPAPPEIAASILSVQMVHRLGAASGGEFNLDRDLHHLELHGGSEPLFTPTDDTLVGKVLANWGMITGEIPVVSTFSIDNLTPVYFKVIAVDESGNKSASSTAVVATAELVDDAHIDSLTVSKVTAGTIFADWTLAARISTANSGSRVENDYNGIRLFNDAEEVTVRLDATNGDATFAGHVTSGVGPDYVDINPDFFGIPSMSIVDGASPEYVAQYNLAGTWWQLRRNDSDVDKGGYQVFFSDQARFGNKTSAYNSYLGFNGELIYFQGKFQKTVTQSGLSALYVDQVGGSGSSRGFSSVSYGATFADVPQPIISCQPTSGNTYGKIYCIATRSTTGFQVCQTEEGFGAGTGGGNYDIMLWAFRKS